MIPFEEIQKYLPKFLSPASEKKLFEELEAFPTNIDKRLYTHKLQGNPVIYQGDGIRELLVIHLPDSKIGTADSVVLSNTCDLDPRNVGASTANMTYIPILKLQKYEQLVRDRGLKTGDALTQHLEAVRQQRITQVFYLPVGGGLAEESLVFLDRICHCRNDFIDRRTLQERRIFSLSDYGAYLFLLKLSIHFTRMTDTVDRGGN